MLKKTTHSIYNEELEELIPNKIPFYVRWGTLIFILIVILISSVCSFIRYPEVIKTSALLTSFNSPKEVKNKVSGKLIHISVVEGDVVDSAQIIGYMQSNAKHSEVIELSHMVDSLQFFVNNANLSGFEKFTIRPFQNLGEMQLPYQTFKQSFIQYKQYLSNGYFFNKIFALKKDLEYLAALRGLLIEKSKIQSEEYILADTAFTMNQKLKNERIIADFEFWNEKSKLLNTALTIPQIKTEMILNDISTHEKQKEISQLQNEIAQQSEIFAQSFNTLKASIDDWKTKYLLISPIEGKIIFSKLILENQELLLNETICYVSPENSTYFAEISIPQTNFGRVKTGQSVLLKFPSYPFEEFGIVKGEISFVSKIPNDSGGFSAKVMLPKGLITNYNIQIYYREKLTASAEIITKDMNLLQRFFYRILEQFKKY